MFYNGLKPGVKLFRIVEGYTEVSEIEKEIESPFWRDKGKVFKLTPIIGNWHLKKFFGIKVLNVL